MLVSSAPPDLSSCQDWFRGIEFAVDEIEKGGDPATVPVVGMAQNAPRPRQLWYRPKDAHEVRFGITQSNR